MRIGKLLRHAAEIELCLEQEGAQELTLRGPLSEKLDIGGQFGAERAYAISDDGRVEMIDAPLYERCLYEVLPADTDTVIVMDADGRAKLYTVQFTGMVREGLIQR